MTDYLRLVADSHRGQPWTHVRVPERLVVVLVFHADGRLVLLSQGRPTFRQRVLCPVMGTCASTDADELASFARAEVRAETGYEARAAEHLFDVARSSGMANEIASVFASEVVGTPGPLDLHAGEDIQPMQFRSLAELAAATTGAIDHVVDAAVAYFFGAATFLSAAGRSNVTSPRAEVETVGANDAIVPPTAHLGPGVPVV